MPKQSVFQVVLIERGTQDPVETPDRLLTDAPILVLATDVQQAAVLAALSLPSLSFNRQRLEVLARPF